jgi:flavin-binding protein dodecin
MDKTQTDSVYRIVDVVGVSEKSWEDAGRRAVETAAGSLRDLRVAEVTQMDMRSHADGYEGGKRQSHSVSHAGCAVIQIRKLMGVWRRLAAVGVIVPDSD